MSTLAHFSKTVTKALEDLQLGESPEGLYAPMHYILALGGKRLRPALCLAGCALYQEDPKAALPPALAIELFHNFSLIHDDVMDKAELRRGEKTVHHKWDLNTAILSGDGMLVKAYEYIAQVPPQALSGVLKRFTQTALEVCEGQQLDMEFEQRQDVLETEYIEMIRLKTSVLIAAALEIGARVGNAPEEDLEKLYHFGLQAGIAFQIQDDILDSFGTGEQTGKLVGGDILNNKETLLLISTRRLANAEQSESLKTAQDLEDGEKISAIQSLMRDSGALKYCEEKRDAYYQKALSQLEGLSAQNAVTQSLKDFAEKLVYRES